MITSVDRDFLNIQLTVSNGAIAEVLSCLTTDIDETAFARFHRDIPDMG